MTSPDLAPEDEATLDAAFADLVPTPLGPMPSAQAAALAADADVRAQARADALAALSAPPLPITGTTVAAVRNSAAASVTDLAARFAAAVEAIGG